MTLMEEYAASGSNLHYWQWLEMQLNQARNKIDQLDKDNDKWLREIHKEEKSADSISQCPKCGGRIVS